VSDVSDKRPTTPPAQPPNEQPEQQQPWSVRGVLTLALCMIVLNIPVSAIVYYASGINKHKDETFLYFMLSPSPFLFLLYALFCAPLAQRLAQEQRRLRALEALAAAAVMYIVYYLSISIALQASGHNADAHDGKQMAGVSIAALIGIFIGAALYPMVVRRLWTPRMPRR
jgi:cellobiose-specific phosphotransferase system component IIC